MVAASQFFIVAGPSVSAVKHSSVFSCDWDSLEEESVRHGAWLSVCWSFSRGLGEIGQRRRRAGPSQASLLNQPASLFPSCALSLICPAALSSILFSFLSSISQRGFIACHSLKPIISSPPTSIPSLPLNNNTQPLDQSSKRADSLIDAYQRIHSYWPVFPIPVIICTALIASLSLYCIEMLFARYRSCSNPNNL